MPRGAQLVCRPRRHRASSLPRLDPIPHDGSPHCADNPDVLSAPGPRLNWCRFRKWAVASTKLLLLSRWGSVSALGRTGSWSE
jgi:hypothetical protein